eukprot:5373702-Amphidinium_carterae.1
MSVILDIVSLSVHPSILSEAVACRESALRFEWTRELVLQAAQNTPVSGICSCSTKQNLSHIDRKGQNGGI